MANAKLSYQRLKHDKDDDDDDDDYDLREKVIGRLRSSSRSRRFNVRRRLRVKIPSLKRILRRKVKLVRTAWKKVCRRLKESQSHFEDLFAGNYLFLQVTPTPFKYAQNSGKLFVKGHPSFGCSVPRINAG